MEGKGEERGKFKIRSRVDGTSRSSRREPRETSKRSRAGGNVLARVRSTRTWSVAIPTERKSGQRNYVTLRKRASIASVSNVSAKRSVNERKEKKKTHKDRKRERGESTDYTYDECDEFGRSVDSLRAKERERDWMLS